MECFNTSLGGRRSVRRLWQQSGQEVMGHRLGLKQWEWAFEMYNLWQDLVCKGERSIQNIFIL